MVLFRYETADGNQSKIEPLDGEFEYLDDIGMWSIKVEEEGGDDIVVWIPPNRLYSIEGRRERISEARGR